MDDRSPMQKGLDDARIMLPDGRIAHDAVKLARIETEGIFVKDAIGSRLVIQTANTRYEFDIISETEQFGQAFKEDGSEPRYLPTRREAKIVGSTFGGSMMKVGYVGVDMYLKFYDGFEDYTVNTSAIRSISKCSLPLPPPSPSEVATQ